MGKRIGRYEIQAELGRGGFGQVFRAYDPFVGRLVAIKTLTAATDTELLTRFRNEAAAAGRLRHPNIVIIYDFGEEEGAPYLVMELLDGQDLERIVTSRHALTLFEKLDIISQAAAGLQHAHTHGIIHRDVKPANIMLLRDGTVKIMDFGIALLTQATAARVTPKGSLIGTFPYMAPEQFYGSASDDLTDIFSFGVTSYKLLTGTHPFHAAEVAAMMHNIINQAPQPLREHCPDCPEALEQAILKLLSKDRDWRYQSLEDLEFDLEPIIMELRRERVHDLLSEARSAMAAAKPEAALPLLREALEIEPGNRQVRELREGVQRQIKDKELRPRIAALVKEGREQLHERHFDIAIQKFESALGLDKSNPELHALIDEARAARENAERGAKLTEEARQQMAIGELTAARKSIAEAASIDPENTQVEELRASIEIRLEARDRERRLKEGLNQAKGLMLVQSFDKAIELLNRLQSQNPGLTAVVELLSRAEAEQEAQARRKQLQAGTEEAKALLRSGEFDAALQRLLELQANFPESAEVRDLSSYAAEELRARGEAQAVSEAAAEAQRLADAMQFEAAIELLRQTVADYPGASGLRDLMQTVASRKAQQERNLAREETSAQAGILIKEQRFQEALERMSAHARAYGDSAALEPLRRQAEDGLEEQRRAAAVRKVVADVQTLLDEGRPDTATEVLQQQTIRFPEDPELLRLLKRAQDQADEKRLIEEMSKVIGEAESLARSHQFDRALELLDGALEQYAGAERLVRCREATLTGKTRYEHDRLQRVALDRARSLREQGKLQEALTALDTALQKLSGDPALLKLKQDISAEQRARSDAAEIRSIADQAQNLIEAQQFERAIQLLDSRAARYPDEDALNQLKLRAETGLRKRQQAGEIAQIAAEAQEHLRASRFDHALKLLDSALRRYGDPEALVRVRDEAARLHEEHERRKQAIEKIKATARSLQMANRLKEAIEELDSGLKRMGSDASLQELRSQVEANLKAEQALQKGLEACQHLLQAGRLEDADSMISGLRKQYRATPALEELETRILQERLRLQEESRQEEEKQNYVSAQLAAIERCASRQEWNAALEIVRRALQQYPQTSQLVSEQIRIEQAIRAERDRKIALAVAAVEQELSSRNWQTAIERAKEELREFPDEPVFEKLRTRAQEQKQKYIETEIAAVRSLIASGDADGAESSFHSNLDPYAREPAVKAVAAEIAAMKARLADLADAQRRQREYITSQLKQAAHCEHKGDYAGAIKVVRNALRTYPDAPELKAKLEILEKRAQAAAEEARLERYAAGRAEAQALMRKHKHEAAIRHYQTLLQEFGGDAQLTADLAIASKARDDWAARTAADAGAASNGHNASGTDHRNRWIWAAAGIGLVIVVLSVSWAVGGFQSAPLPQPVPVEAAKISKNTPNAAPPPSLGSKQEGTEGSTDRTRNDTPTRTNQPIPVARKEQSKTVAPKDEKSTKEKETVTTASVTASPVVKGNFPATLPIEPTATPPSSPASPPPVAEFKCGALPELKTPSTVNKRGAIVWVNSEHRAGEVTICNGLASTGTVKWGLPGGVPVVISATASITNLQQPTEKDHWSRFSFHVNDTTPFVTFNWKQPEN